MISIVCCSRKDPSWDLHYRNVNRTASIAPEYIRIDNRQNFYSLCSAYNEGVSKASGDIIVFMHEDAYFMEQGWDTVLNNKFSDPSIGLVGVAGTQYLSKFSGAWVSAGRPFIRGRVIHELQNGATQTLTVFNWDKNDCDVVAVDGLFFAIRKDLFSSIRFDDKTFDTFHFYDMDICLQILASHRLIVTWDLMIKHFSGGSFDAQWREYEQLFLKKWAQCLPVSVSSQVPDFQNPIPFENYDLKGKVPTGFPG